MEALCGVNLGACVLLCGTIYSLVYAYSQGTDCDYLCSIV